MEAPIVAGVAAMPVRRQLGCTARDAAADVALEAIADAGLDPKDVDALFVSPPGLTGPPGFMWSCALAHHLGLRTRAQALIECGGTTALQTLTAACDAVRLGRAERALAVAIDQRTPDMPPDLEHIGEPLGSDEPRPRALVFENRVRRDGRAMDQLLDRLGRHPQGHDPLHEPGRLIPSRGRHLAYPKAVDQAVECNQVGEGSTDVDTDAKGRVGGDITHVPMPGLNSAIGRSHRGNPRTPKRSH